MNDSITNQCWKLLQPVQTISIPDKSRIRIFSTPLSSEEINSIFSRIPAGLLAVDIETTGTQAADPLIKIVGIGLSTGADTFYFDVTKLSPVSYAALLNNINDSRYRLIGHNVYFDSCFLTRDSGAWGNWVGCTYGLYRQLANEGFPGQKWSLKSAQIDMLGWTETNEPELDNWLISNGYWKSPSLEEKAGSYKIDTENGERWVKSDKSKMSNAPADILGYYCGLDAYSTYMFYYRVLDVAILRMPVPAASQAIRDYHSEFLNQVRLHVYQQLRGILIDTEELANHLVKITEGIKEAGQRFLSHPDIILAINDYNQAKLLELRQKQPAQYLSPPKLGAEPARLTKAGSPSKTWENWEKKRQAGLVPVVSKNYLKWEAQYKTAEATNHFNINSGPQRQWLFYDKLKYPVILKTDKGLPAVDKRALLAWGEPGKILKTQNDLVKEQGYVQGCLDSVISNVLHAQFRMPGTLTGRLAGSGGVNIQQLPKSRGYLECYRARPGMVFVDCDHSSLEQVVLAELSRDRTLLELYGPGAKPNDVYLFNGSQLPGVGKAILDAGYDPKNPTKEGIEKAKKLAKESRTVAKVVTLASSYGAGAGKIKETLNLQGIKLSLDEAKQIHSAYWQLYQGVKLYERYLLDEHRKRGGWVYNGVGRPVCVDNNYLKDIVNRVVQSTGHDVHILWSNIFSRLCEERGLEVHGIVWDFHDQTIVECREEIAEKIRLTYLDAYDILNQKLQGLICIKGDPQIVNNLAEAKL